MNEDKGPAVRPMDPASRTRARALLLEEIRRDGAAVQAGDRSRDGHALAPRPPTPRRAGSTRRWAVAGGAVAAATAGFLVLPGVVDQGAYATWTAVPAGVDVRDARAAGETCRTYWDDNVLAGSEERLPGLPTAEELSTMETVLAERRGDYTYTLVGNGEWVAECLAGEDVRSGAMTELASYDGTLAPAGVEVHAWGATKSDEGTYSTVSGRVGTDVTAVVVTPSNGATVEATVVDGHFAAWWPGTIADDLELALHLADGSTVDGVSAQELIAQQRLAGP